MKRVEMHSILSHLARGFASIGDPVDARLIGSGASPTPAALHCYDPTRLPRI